MNEIQYASNRKKMFYNIQNKCKNKYTFEFEIVFIL